MGEEVRERELVVHCDSSLAVCLECDTPVFSSSADHHSRRCNVRSARHQEWSICPRDQLRWRATITLPETSEDREIVLLCRQSDWSIHN